MRSEHKVKITYVISHVDYSFGFDWVSRYLDTEKFELSFIFINDKTPELFNLFRERSQKVFYINYRGKKDLPSVMLRLIGLFIKIRPDVVHAHLIWATILSMPAAFITRIKRRIYTRHHSTYHIQNYPKMVKLDKLNNLFATKIIAVSQTVKNVLISFENVPPDKITVINHGFDFKELSNPNSHIIDQLKSKYHTADHYPVIGVISRLIEWKGIQYIIEAFRHVLSEYPRAKLVLANAKGNYRNQIIKLLEPLPEESFILIDFEKDVFNLYHLFDVFVHVPVDPNWEAFGQIYVEALACRIPSVFTLSGVAKEFIVNEKNALTVPFCNSSAITEAVLKILNDKMLRDKITEQGYHDVIERFTVFSMIANLEKEYAA